MRRAGEGWVGRRRVSRRVGANVTNARPPHVRPTDSTVRRRENPDAGETTTTYATSSTVSTGAIATHFRIP